MRKALALAAAAGVMAASASAGNYQAPSQDEDPVWSPDGRQLAFSRGIGDGRDLLVLDVATKRTRKLLTGGSSSSPSIGLSPDWGWLAVNTWVASGPVIRVSRPDGSDARIVGQTHPYIGAAWAPDSFRLLFIGLDHRFYEVGRDGSGLRPVLDGYRSPDWTKLLSLKPAGTSTRLIVSEADGANARTVAEVAGSPGAVRWSPESGRLAYAVESFIEVVDVATALIRSYPVAGPGSAAPCNLAWAPDGQRIAFGTPSALHVLELATGATRAIGSVYGCTQLMWSPDSAEIALAAGRECGNRSGLYLANVDQRRLRRMTNDCRVVGTAGRDVLTGTERFDLILGLGGDDRIQVRQGWGDGDELVGGAGNDTLVDSPTGDVLRGGSGNDLLEGGGGSDVIFGDSGRDTIDGGANPDTIYARDGERDIVSCGTNNNRRNPEHDVAFVDRFDRAGADCEIVYRAAQH